MTEPDWAALESAWEPARATGVLGPATLSELREHAAGFVPAACRVPDRCRGLDAGTGAGVPGLFLAMSMPDSQWALVDASERRCTMAQAAVTAMGLSDRVEVVHRRLDELAHEAAWRGRADLVVARLFASSAELAECALPLVKVGGGLHVSTNAVTEAAWRRAPLEGLGARVGDHWSTPAGRYLRIDKVGDGLARFPRRFAARRRAPLF